MDSLQETGNMITSGEGIWGWGMRVSDLVFKEVEAILNLKFFKNGTLYIPPPPVPPIIGKTLK